MRAKDIISCGIPSGNPLNEAIGIIRRLRLKKGRVRAILKDLSNNPEAYLDDADWKKLSQSILDLEKAKIKWKPRSEIAPYRIWGEGIEPDATGQMINACMLPVAVAGALMPDAHGGYGLPIGGVLATKNAVIPYAVGVDIACRMRLSVYDVDPGMINTKRNKLVEAIEKETRFGVGCHFDPVRNHEVMDLDWDFCKVVRKLKDTAWKQLGTSGGGNHFAEFGSFVVDENCGLQFSKDPQKPRLAFLTHSGSRGAGGKIAQHYSKLAQKMHMGLPKHLMHLAWLPMDSDKGQEYWAAMNLMGEYAAANHELIHQGIAKRLGLQAVIKIENHHNFAWKEMWNDQRVIVHRKGATPAHRGVLGVIPGSMGTPGYVVRGKGVDAALNSASHGAGRRMSRTKAKKTFTKKAMDKFLADNQVTLISGGLDECPQAYKDIHEVMRHQSDLVEIQGEFLPRLVKMAPDEKPRWKK